VKKTEVIGKYLSNLEFLVIINLNLIMSDEEHDIMVTQFEVINRQFLATIFVLFSAANFLGRDW
jgi:dimeric dUTPase (all-alpha-NTP-PPase superfamily)